MTFAFVTILQWNSPSHGFIFERTAVNNYKMHILTRFIIGQIEPIKEEVRNSNVFCKIKDGGRVARNNFRPIEDSG